MVLKNYPQTSQESSMRNCFVGIPSFLMAPMCFNLDELDADIAILGMPYDMGTAVRAGARLGPRGVRIASAHNCYAHEGWYDPIRGKRFEIIDNIENIEHIENIDKKQGSFDKKRGSFLLTFCAKKEII